MKSLTFGILLFVCSVHAETFKTSKLGIAMGYSVREVCSCVFVEKRTEIECLNDYGLKTLPVKVSVDLQSRTVKATLIPQPTVERTASFDGKGCAL